MAIKIGLLGLGTVGAGTAEILLSPEGRHPLLQELEIYRVGVRDRTKTRSLQYFFCRVGFAYPIIVLNGIFYRRLSTQKGR